MTYVRNEFIVIEQAKRLGDVWAVIYEQLDCPTLVESSLSGTLHNGCQRLEFSEHQGKLVFNTPTITGFLHRGAGVRIVLGFDRDIGEEHFMCVSYQTAEVCQKLSWCREGF